MLTSFLGPHPGKRFVKETTFVMSIDDVRSHVYDL